MSVTIQLDPHTTMYDLFKSQQSTDIKFICTNGEIGAHSQILKSNSKWFQINNNISVIALMESSKEIVSDFLTILYVGSGSFSDTDSLKKLLNMFQCTYHIKELNRIKNETANETEIPPSTSEVQPQRFLPNPYALNSPVGPHKKKGSSKTSKTTGSYESPNLIPTEDNNRKNTPNNVRDEEKNNSQLSDSSDVCIIECPPSLIEINDTLTQDLVDARESKVEKNIHVSPEKSITLKRKPDNDEDCIRVDGNTSDETDIETTATRFVPKKRKNVETGNDEIRTDPQGDNSDGSDVHLPRRRIYQVGQQKNIFRFDSTDDEDSTQQKSDIERKIMGFQSVGEMRKELANFCLICEDYHPMFRKHLYTHQLPRKQVSCSECSNKFYKVTLLKRHRRLCKTAKQ